MRSIFYVNGKIFYSERTFKKYVLENKLEDQVFKAYHFFHRKAWLEKVTRKPGMPYYTPAYRHEVRYSHH